ncbi:activating transcription factor 7-interacting protein 1 [Centroberyx affinis]|uniref:activating transcription factor 7-interacting protein 1 n=1 Tax=Centroberyx affinis TaxID=166261 RepID=UPI003A5BFED0
MEVVVAEEKKKIFRARKTMKISDRQQLETLHNTLLTGASPLSNPSPPPLLNGTHKEDGQKVADKEQNNTLDSNSPHAASPVSPASRGSPAPSLSLNLSPSPPSSQSPKAKEETPTSPISPFHSLNFELKKMEEEGKKGSSPSSSNDCPASAPTEAKEGQKKDPEVVAEMEKKEETHTTTEGPVMDSVKDSAKGLAPPASPAVSGKKSDKDHRTKSDCTEPMETDKDTTEAKAPEASTAKRRVEKPPSPKATTSASSPHATSTPASSSSRPAPPSSLTVPKQDPDIKEEEDIKEEVKDDKQEAKQGSIKVEKMEVDSVKVEIKKEKNAAGQSTKPSRPSSTPPSDTAVQEKGSTSGLKRTLSEGSEKDGKTVERDGKRPKVDGVELEAQLELKITAKGSSRLKLEKVVQQLVEERLRVLQLTVFDKSLQELKDRVDKIDCATKHQTTLNALQAKIARLAKKFGEANQASENKRKQEVIAAAAAAATAAATAAAATAAKTAAAANTPPTQRTVRTPMEIKQTTTTLASTSTTAPTAQPTPVPTSTSTAMMSQAPILQLITSASNAASTLAAGITTQSPTGTLLLKTAPGSGMMATGQPLLIQLPLSMTNGQTGTLVNIPVSSLSAANSLNKAKTTTSTATFILKPAPATTTTASSQAAITVPALQASTGQMSPAQISLARAVYQGGAGGITTPNAGVSVTTARTPAQSVSVAGAMSSTSSPATSGPAATGSTAPGPPQGTSMTSKTDNQATGSTPAKAAAPGARPKGSVIDLTEDDDDVQVTGVKNATVATTPATQRSHPVVSIPTSAAARSSPQSNQNYSNSSNPQLTVHHRPPLDSPMKSRAVTTTTPTRAPTIALPPLPTAPSPTGRLPPEAAQTSLPQQPQLKLVPSQTGIVLSWCVAETDRTCATVDSYHLYAFHQDNSSSNAAQQHWKKIGEVKALALPMACTLTQFQSGSTYHFAVRAKDIYGRYGSFCEPQCTNVINSSSS